MGAQVCEWGIFNKWCTGRQLSCWIEPWALHSTVRSLSIWSTTEDVLDHHPKFDCQLHYHMAGSFPISTYISKKLFLSTTVRKWPGPVRGFRYVNTSPPSDKFQNDASLTFGGMLVQINKNKSKLSINYVLEERCFS